MASHKDDDPFSWDIDRVVQELCSSKRTWVPTPRMQFPDPADLEAKLREGEYDGELLLSSLTNEADLWSDLGITRGKFKQTLRTAIAQLRTRSPEYRKYERLLHCAPEDDLPFKRENQFLSPGLTDTATPASPAVDRSTPEQILGEAPARTFSVAVQNDLRHARNDDSDNSAKPKKKRRLETSGLTKVDLPARDTAISTAILTEADRFMVSSQPSNLLDRVLSGPGAYWGEGKLTLDDLFAHDVTDVDDDREFAWVQSQRVGRAKAKWVNSKMMKFLCETPLLEDTASDALPLFGESDEEDNPLWDLIERERDEEDEEVRQEKLRAEATCLHSDEIEASIQEMIQELAILWAETKLSTHQRKAYKIWNHAQQSRTRNKQIIQLTQSLRNENERLQGKVRYLQGNSYSSKRELRGLKPTLEPTVFEIEKIKWTITVLQGSRAPDKPDKASVPAKPRGNKKPKISSDGGIDIWSEDELDDFIVNDDSLFHATDDETSTHFADDELPGIINQPDDAMDVDAHTMNVDAPRVHDPGQSFRSTSDGDIEMFDLTQVEEADDPIELHTPIKSTSKTNVSSPLSSPQGDGQLPYSDPEKIAEKGTEYWRNKRDHKRLLVTLISNLSTQRRVKVLESAIYSDTPEELWQDQIEVAIMFHSGARDSEQPSDKVRRDVAMSVARFFHVFCGDSRPLGVEKFSAAGQQIMQKIAERKDDHFEEFWTFLRFLAPYFNVKPLDQEDVLLKGIATAEENELTPHQKSTRARLQKSARIRLHEAHSSQAKEARRLEFRAAANVAGGPAGLVVNESKEAGQGLVYVHPHIAHRIRPHQLEGVRFMWDEITKDTHKGCLLAHTMGLGKTMQTITLLSALAEAATSEDETVSSQIPEHLKVMKIVILCPVNVFSNWVEELYNWTPPHLLGNIHKLESSVNQYERSQVVEDWATEAGGSVLVVGYSLLISLKEDVRQRIQDVCSIVIGDEAHCFKNRVTKTGMAVNSFKTTSRIALTGSPLSNNVKEYYSMIDWVAPGFLGDPGEFNMRYGNPIEHGLSVRSDRGASRKAKVLLAALKKLVETKVHRMSMHALKGDLPPKVEFIIYLDLSDIQLAAYKAYLQGDLRNRPGGKIIVNNVWALQAVLPLLLAHPSIYHCKLKKDCAKIVEDMKEVKEIITEAEQPEEGGSDTASLEAPLGIPSETVLDALKVFDEPDKYNALSASYKMLVLDKIIEESLRLGDNVLVFSQKLAILDYIQEHLLQRKFRKSYRIDGAVNPNTRQGKVHSFNKSHGAVFLISTTAGGVGLNLHGANRVVIMDSQYNPTHEQQAVGRAYRIGQTKPVFVYWLLCDGTFEKTMQSKQIFKTQLSSRVVDDKAPIAKSDRNLSQWFTQPIQVPHQDTSHFRGRDPVLDAVLNSDITTGISSMETTDTFEEEEEDKELQPNELEQANQMALGNISELTLPDFSEDRHPSNSIPMPTVAHQSKVGGTSNLSALLQVHQQFSAAGFEAAEYGGPELWAKPLSRASAPGDLGLTYQGSADDSILHGFNRLGSQANAPTQAPTGNAFTRTGPGMKPSDVGATPPAFSQTTPLPFCMPGAEQVHQDYRAMLGDYQPPVLGTPNSHLFTTLLGTPKAEFAWQHRHPYGFDSVSSAAAGNPNEVASRPQARTTSLAVPSSFMVGEGASATRARDTFKLALREAVGTAKLVQGEALLDSIEEAMVSANIHGLARRTVWLKLQDVVKEYTKAAEAMVSQQASAFTLVTAQKAQVLLALGIHAAKDPDHARDFLRRSNKKQNDTNSAADFAAMESVLRKRQEKPIKQEKERSKQTEPSNGLGTSIFDPLVIDD